MIAHALVFRDKEYFGRNIPKEFVEFVNGILNPRDADAETLYEMICYFPKENSSTIKQFLIDLISSDYTDKQIVEIFRISGAKIIYLGIPQREVILQFLEVITFRAEGKTSKLPAFPDFRKNKKF